MNWFNWNEAKLILLKGEEIGSEKEDSLTVYKT